jgi:hypothetical protein
MERRYQVFVSSTYEDLEEERREVIQALLAMGCIPAGMELFPATDDDQWTLIKREIDQSDYYIMISAGKYGSVHPTENKSFTQMEYEYAVSKGKPVIAFLHKDPGKLAVDKIEVDADRRQELEAFRGLAMSRHCKMWDSCDSLAKAVYQSIHSVMREKPSPGWVRATGVYDESEMLALKNRHLQLENELQPLRQAGLVNAGTSPYTIDWGTLFSNAKRLDILFAYGRTWRNSRVVELTEFVCIGDNRMRVVLPDPENDNVVSELSRRFSCAPAELKAQIIESARHFLSLKSLPNCRAQIQIWFYPFAPQYALFRFDDSVVVTLYSHRRTRGGVVTLHVKGGILASYMQDEFKYLIDDEHARPVTEAEFQVQEQQARV